MGLDANGEIARARERRQNLIGRDSVMRIWSVQCVNWNAILIIEVVDDVVDNNAIYIRNEYPNWFHPNSVADDQRKDDFNDKSGDLISAFLSSENEIKKERRKKKSFSPLDIHSGHKLRIYFVWFFSLSTFDNLLSACYRHINVRPCVPVHLMFFVNIFIIGFWWQQKQKRVDWVCLSRSRPRPRPRLPVDSTWIGVSHTRFIRKTKKSESSFSCGAQWPVYYIII